jgi:hypothetical protein
MQNTRPQVVGGIPAGHGRGRRQNGALAGQGFLIWGFAQDLRYSVLDLGQRETCDIRIFIRTTTTQRGHSHHPQGSERRTKGGQRTAITPE